MKRYKCTVAYDGSRYCGWQSQRNGDSVQEQIEAVIARFTHEDIRITGSGRTDAKVNAEGQVFHFDTDLEMTPYKWKGALNGFLPKDIHIKNVEEVDDMFHARYCVAGKRYDYRIHIGEYDVHSRNYAYQYPRELDVEKMKEGAAYLVGRHDFTTFNSNSKEETPDQVRTIYSIDIVRVKDMITLSYYGEGFLRYMVRYMTASLIEVGKGTMKPEQIKVMLEAKKKSISKKNVPGEGLTLMEVNYFRILSETEECVIREVLPGDRNIPENTEFVLASRHTDEVYGEVFLKENEALVRLKDSKNAVKVEDIRSDFEKRVKIPLNILNIY